MIPEAIIAALIAVGSFLAGRAWEITRSNRSIRALRRRSPYLAAQLDAVAMEAGRIMSRPEGQR